MPGEAKIRCKFMVHRVRNEIGKDGEVVGQEITMGVVYPRSGEAIENAQYWKSTPSGQIIVTFSNPTAFDHLPVGAQFYVDIIPAPA